MLNSLKRRNLLLAVVALALGCIAAALWQFSPIALAVVRPTLGPAVEAVYATGTVEPSVMMPIAARSAARLAELLVDEGEEVRKGQLLGRLEDDDLQETMRQLAAQERWAKTDYERNARLSKSGTIARAVVERARADWDAARAATLRASAQAGFMKLVAPTDGRVIRRDGEIGQLIAANQPVYWLSCRSLLRVAAEVDEEDISRVQSGQEVLIRADAFPGQVFRGRVATITPKGDAIARSYRVRISLAAATPLMIGMTAETNIVLRENKDALLLPASAVRDNKVWLVRDGHISAHRVTVGAKSADRIEITQGIAPTDTVVANPDATLREGQRVRPLLAAIP